MVSVPVRARALVLLSLLLLATAPVPSVDASDDAGRAGCPNERFVERVGWVCDGPAGLLRLRDSGETTHGLDPAPSELAPQAAPYLAPRDPPICVEDASGYYAHVIYTHAADRSSQYPTRAPEIRALVERANGLLNLEAQKFGYTAEYKVLCAGAEILVDAVQLSTTQASTTFDSIVSALRSNGYQDPKAKYMVWHEQSTCGGGIGHFISDDDPTVENPSNGNTNSGLVGVTWGCRGDHGVRVIMHENGHNLGAVQYTAPDSNGLGHCNDGQDIMCYGEGGQPYNPSVCTDRQHFDCGHDTYFHPNPPPGSHLAGHWNLGSQVNRYMEIQPVHPLEPLWSEDFDDGSADGWAMGGLWHIDDACAAAASAPYYLGWHDEDCDYDSIFLFGDATFQVDLSGQLMAALEIDHRWVTEVSEYTVDLMTISVSTDGGGSFAPIAQWNPSIPNRPDWHTYRIGLDPYVGKTIHVRFSFDAETIYDNQNPGWYLDNVTILATDNLPPVADAGWDQSTTDGDNDGYESFVLDGSASHDRHDGGSIVAYEWWLGDELLGKNATQQVTVPHGDHNVTLTVTDDKGGTANDTVLVHVFPNSPPIVFAGSDRLFADTDGDGLQSFDLHGTGNDADGTVVGYAWSHNGTVFATTEDADITLPIGTHLVTLTVTDNGGATSNDTVTLELVPNTPPAAQGAQSAPVSDHDGDGMHAVPLDATASTDPDGSIVAWDWYLDASLIATGATAEAVLPVGTHEVTLVVTDEGNATDQAPVQVAVYPNAAPTATVGPAVSTSDADGDGHEAVPLDGTGSSDPDGTLVAYDWTRNGTVIATGASATVTLPLGDHTLTLTVTDDGGATAVADLSVLITDNLPPAASFTALCSLHSCTFDAAASDDPDGTIKSYHWDLGDGNATNTTGPSLVHDYTDPVDHTICLTVSDEAGAQATSCQNITGHDLVLIERFDAPSPAWTYEGLWHLGDACGDAPTRPTYLGYHVEGSCTMANGEFHWGMARRSVDLQNVANPALSILHRWDTYECCGYHQQWVTVRADPNGSWTTIWYTDASHPDQPEWGTLELDLSRWAGSKVDIGFQFMTGTSSNTRNDRPGWHIDGVQVAADPDLLVPFDWDPTAVIEGATVAGDADGDGHEALPFTGSSSSDPDGELIRHTWSLDDQVVGDTTNVTLAIPVGDHLVNLTVEDATGARHTTSLPVTVTPNQPPMADAGPDQDAVDADGDGKATLFVDGSGSSDPDGTVTDHEWSLGGVLLADTSAAGVSLPVGVHVVTLTVTDHGGATAEDTVALTVHPNSPPTANAGPDLTLRDTDGTGVEGAMLDGSGSSDPEGPVTHAWSEGGVLLADSATPTIPLAVGSHDVTLTVTDGGNATDTDTVRVIVLDNEPPVAIAPPNITQNDDDRTGEETVGFDGTASFDPDAQVTAWEWYRNGMLVATGPTPTASVPIGSHEITLLVRDAANASATDTFLVTITDNRPPISTFTFACNDDVRCTLDASPSSDPDGDPLTYAWDFGDGKTDEGEQVIHHFPHAGSFPTCLTVDDGFGLFDVTCWTIHLTDLHLDESFDDGLANGWSLGGLWHIDSRCATASSPPSYLGYHQGLLCNYQSTARTEGTAKVPIDLRGATEAHLNYRERWDVEPYSGSPRDWMNVQVWTLDDGTLTTLKARSSQHGDQPFWSTESFDLSPWTGERIELRFQFDSINALHNLDRGWFLDDVRVVSDGIRPNAPPDAALSATCDQGTCTFDGTASTDDRYVVDWEWDFGDANTGTGNVTSHAYTASGTYTVALTVTDNRGDTDTATTTVTVDVPDTQPPSAAFTASCDGTNCTFDGTASSDADGTIVTWTWDFGDGTDGEGNLTEHAYAVEGDHNVTLFVTDDDGLTTSTTKVVQVGGSRPPTAAFTHTCAGLDCTFDGTASSDTDGTVVSWSWDFGDGTNATGARVTHSYPASGTYTVTLGATDDDGQHATTNTTVEVDGTKTVKEAPRTPPGDAHMPDRVLDLVGDRIPIPWMDLQSAWFDHDAHHLYAGMKLLDVPTSDRTTAFVAYRVHFTPTWDLADPTLGGAIPPGEIVQRFEARALLSPIGAPGSPTIFYTLWAETQDAATYQTQWRKIADLDGGTSVDTDILWWPIERAHIGAPPGATLTEPSAIASPSIRGFLNTYGVTGDSTGVGRDHTF